MSALILVAALVAQAPERTILAIGAHAGDMELTSGAVLALHAQQGDRVVILHLTLGEGGHPRRDPAAYAVQKRREAEAAARVLGAEVRFAPYEDGQIPDTEPSRRYVAEVIRQVRPTHIITHWKQSIHKDHATAHRIVVDAVLLAALEGVELQEPAYRGVRGIYFAENWEDAEGFEPYLYIDVSDAEPTWRQAIREYEFTGAAFSGFAYRQYYEALHALRGAQIGRSHAVAFDLDPLGKRRVLERLP
jgi:LmbE family N-acetylglucosaminyl deacetylase